MRVRERETMTYKVREESLSEQVEVLNSVHSDGEQTLAVCDRLRGHAQRHQRQREHHWQTNRYERQVRHTSEITRGDRQMRQIGRRETGEITENVLF